MDMSFLSNARRKFSLIIIFSVFFTVLISFIVQYYLVYTNETTDIPYRSKTIYSKIYDYIDLNIFNIHDLYSYRNFSSDKIKISDIRILSELNALYTIKKLDSGELVYLISSFNDARDNYEVGTPVDSDIYDIAIQAYNGTDVVFTDRMNINGHKSIAVFYPVYSDNDNISGVIGMEFPADFSNDYLYAFSFTCLPLIVIFASVMASVFPKYIKNTIACSLEKNICTDTLTSLKNRIAYDKKIEELDTMIKEKKENISITLVLSNLSELKETNNSIGDKAGDKYIVDSANLINNSFAHLGTTYRTGGGEFATIIENTEESVIHNAIEEMKKSEAAYNSDSTNQVKMKITVIFDSFIPDKDKSFISVIKRADEKNCKEKQFEKELKERKPR
ncbi:MAG: diguanylate cyclase [Firmicutes bacterium]|nr:diguanylate cyclase [Bacillota bacterium]